MSTTAQAVTLDSQNNIHTVDFDQHVQQQRQQNAPGDQPANLPVPEVLMAQMREELDRLKGENQILATLQTQRTNSSPPASVKAPVLFETILGRYQWGGINKMTREQQAALLGADATVTDECLREIFGRGANAQLQAELQRANPRNYAILREFAKLRRVYAN